MSGAAYSHKCARMQYRRQYLLHSISYSIWGYKVVFAPSVGELPIACSIAHIRVVVLLLLRLRYGLCSVIFQNVIGRWLVRTWIVSDLAFYCSNEFPAKFRSNLRFGWTSREFSWKYLVVLTIKIIDLKIKKRKSDFSNQMRICEKISFKCVTNLFVEWDIMWNKLWCHIISICDTVQHPSIAIFKQF